MRRLDAEIRMVERAYDLAGSHDTWLDGLHAELRPFFGFEFGLRGGIDIDRCHGNAKGREKCHEGQQQLFHVRFFLGWNALVREGCECPFPRAAHMGH